jgi:hypothetical protein
MERILITGDRFWTDKKFIESVLMLISRVNIECIIEGEAPGADTAAKELADKYNIHLEPFPAKWKQYGRAAGPIRNQQMLDEGKPTLVLAFHDNLNESSGTKDMIERSLKAGIPLVHYSHKNPKGYVMHTR